MKTALFILSTAAAFIFSQPGKPDPEKRHPVITEAYIDSVLEAGRVEMMRYKMQ